MLVLFETPAGYALFKVSDEGKVSGATDLYKDFATPEKAADMVKLKAFSAFDDTTDAVAASADMIEGKMSKSLKKFLTKNIVKSSLKDKLAVADSKLGNAIKDKLEIPCIADASVNELMRGIRTQLETLLHGVGDENLKAMRLGLSHSLSRYKLKFSADKVDTMIVQAIGLLDELDKEVNIYAMRVREWYGWHFPEMAKVLNDNMHYAKCVIKMGTRDNAKNCDFSAIIGDDSIEADLKEVAEVSMGTEITEGDVISIKALAEQVVSLSEYRIQLFDYLKNRMNAIAPNLTIMVGELVGARLIAHSGSLLNLAKQPASTVQILGAEKALFRALKTKNDTPKYGLIYHASIIGQTAPKSKGKISRVLAAKCALAIRVDALGETDDTTVGMEGRAKVEARVRQLEGGGPAAVLGSAKKGAAASKAKVIKKYDSKAAVETAPAAYNPAEDMPQAKEEKKDKSAKKKKRKAETQDVEEGEEGTNGQAAEDGEAKKEKKSKKKKSKKDDEEGSAAPAVVVAEEGEKKEKKKKKKKSKE